MAEMTNKQLWEEHKNDLVWFDDETINAAYNAIDKHVANGNGDKTALIYEAEDGSVNTYTFADLAKASNKYANYFKNHVVNRGDRVFIFLPRVPDLFIAFLAILKHGAIAGTEIGVTEPEATFST